MHIIEVAVILSMALTVICVTSQMTSCEKERYRLEAQSGQDIIPMTADHIAAKTVK